MIYGNINPKYVIHQKTAKRSNSEGILQNKI